MLSQRNLKAQSTGRGTIKEFDAYKRLINHKLFIGDSPQIGGRMAVGSYLLLVVTAGLLFYIAATDLRAYKIPNEAVLLLLALFFVHAALSGRWVELHWHLGFALLTSILMLFCYAQGLMGGGDLKLLAVAFLWSGLHCAIPFLIFLLVFAALHTLAAKLEWVNAQRVNGRIKVAFAPAIAFGLIGIFAMGCVSPH